MALRASVVLDFKTQGSEQAKRAVQGVVQATQRAADQARKAAAEEKAKARENERALRRLAQVVSETAKAKLAVEKRTAAETLRVQRAADRAATASRKAAAKAASDAARQQAREEERWAAAKLRALGRIAREEERLAARSARQHAQGVRNMRRGAIQTAAGLATLGATGINEVRGFGSTLGVRSREEMVQRAMTFERGLIRLGGQAGLSEEQRAATRERMLAVARSTQTDPMDLLASASMAQNRFSDFRFFEENAQRFAEASNALDVPMEDIVGAVGEFRRQMGVTSEEIPELIGRMTAAAQAGSIEFSDISAEFAQTIGTWSRVTGQTGMQGASQFLAGAEVLGAGGMGGAGANVLMTNLLAKMSNADVQRNMRRAGINMTDRRTGQFVGLPNLVEQLIANRRTDSATELQNIFGRDMQANQAIGILMSEVRKAQAEGRENPLTMIANAQADAGNRVIDDTNRALLNSTSGRARQVGVNAELEFLENGDALIRSMTNMAGPLAELENRFPRVAQGLESLQGAIANLLAVMAGLRLAGGGAVLASTVNAGAGTAVATTAAGGTAAAGGGGLFFPALAAGLSAYGLYDMYKSGGERSWAWDIHTQNQAANREERNRIARSMGMAGQSRMQLEEMSNWRGVYDSGEAGNIIRELENARRMLSGQGDGGRGLELVMQKIRDIGALDEVQSSAAGREVWERAQGQVERERALMQEQTRAMAQNNDANTTRLVTAIQGITTPSPATGSTTGPTVMP